MDLRVREGAGGEGGGLLLEVFRMALLMARSALVGRTGMISWEGSRRVVRERREGRGEEKYGSASLRLGMRWRVGLDFMVRRAGVRAWERASEMSEVRRRNLMCNKTKGRLR